MSELNELFEQILHSEQNFKSRHSKLRALSEAIQECKAELRGQRDRCSSLRGELVLKNNKLAGIEVDLHVLSGCTGALQRQREQLEESETGLHRQVEENKRQLEEQRKCFTDELRSFACCYDLCGRGYKHREELSAKRKAVLQDEVMCLETELVEMDVQEEAIDKLRNELNFAEMKMNSEKERDKVLSASLAGQKGELEEIKAEKQSVALKLSRDPEFIRMQRDLEKCRECPEERACVSLQGEFEELQRLSYQKQMHNHLTLQRRALHSTTTLAPPSSTSSRHTSHHHQRPTVTSTTTDANVSVRGGGGGLLSSSSSVAGAKAAKPAPGSSSGGGGTRRSSRDGVLGWGGSRDEGFSLEDGKDDLYGMDDDDFQWLDEQQAAEFDKASERGIPDPEQFVLESGIIPEVQPTAAQRQLPGPSVPGPSVPCPSVPGPSVPGPSVPGPSVAGPVLGPVGVREGGQWHQQEHPKRASGGSSHAQKSSISRRASGLPRSAKRVRFHY